MSINKDAFRDEGEERETKRFGAESRLTGGRESTNSASRLLNTIVAAAAGTLATATLCAVRL